MKWKDEVTIEKRKNIYRFHMSGNEMPVDQEDVYICDAIEGGMTDDKELLRLIMKKEDENEVIASLRLAQFVLDYGDFISNDLGHMVIEP
ncbi:MAG: hypothetical protein ACI39Q_04410 [Wujia sp.]